MEPEDATDDFRELTVADLFQDERQGRALATYYQENHIFRNGQAVHRLLTEFENYTASSQVTTGGSQVTLLTALRKALEELPTNGRVLAQPDILRAAIRLCLNSEAGKIQDEMLTILSYVFRCSALPDSLVKSALEKVVVDFHNNRVEAATLLTTARIFSRLYQSKNIGTSQPKGEMYFHGQQELFVQTRKSNLTWPFYKGYTFAVWVYLEKVKHDADAPLGKLFTFHAEGSGGLETYIIEDKLYYRVLGATYTEPHVGSNGMYLCSIEPRKWHFLAIEHEQPKTLSRSKLNVYLEKRLVNNASIDPPRPPSSARTSIRLFNGMYCRTSSVALFLSPIGNRVEELSKNMNSIEYLKDAKALVFEARAGKVYERSGFGWSDCPVPVRSRRMNCTHILPFFYLLRFVEATNEPLFKELAHIIIHYLRADRENQQEAERLNFFKLLANLLLLVPSEVFGPDTINVLLQIKHNITEQRLLDQFVCHLLWKLLKSKASTERRIEIFQVLKSCFTQNLIHFSSHLGFDELLNYVATFEVRSVDCCEKHQRAMHPQQGFVENKQEELLAGMLQLIELLFSNTKIDLTLELPKLARMLCLKFSPCFQLSLLCMLRKVLMDKLGDKLGEEQGRKTLKALAEKKVYLIFLHLISSSPFVDVKAQSLKMIFFLLANQKGSSSLSEVDLTHYISSVLWNVNEAKKDPSSPVRQAPLRRAESKPLSEPEGPQAPSMSNRRNPNTRFLFAQPQEAVVMEEEKTVDPETTIRPSKKKKNFDLNIDTDKINEIYSFGGEKGKQIQISTEEVQEEIDNIRELTFKCLKAMKPNQPVELGRRPEVHSVRENRRITFPVAPLNSTRNQDLADRKPRGFGPPANLRIIEESERSASEQRSKPRSEVSEEDTRRTPKISPSQKKQEHENMLTLYSALLEGIFHRPIAKIIAPCPKIVSVACLDMMLGWGCFFSNEIKTVILTDLTIMVEQKANMEMLTSNKEILKFILSSVYCAFASSNEELLRVAVGLLKVLFQHIFLFNEDALPKFVTIAKWPRQSNDSTYNLCLCVLASRYCFSRIIEEIQEVYAQNNGNDSIWQNNFNSLCLVTQQMIYSHYNPVCPSLDVRDNGLTYLLNSSDVPVLIREYFKHDWLDFNLASRLMTLFNKFFTSKSYLVLKNNGPNQRFIEAMLDNRNNLEALRDCDYYLSSSHQRGILLELSGIWNAMVTFCRESNIESEQESLELICLGKLLLVLGEVLPARNSSGKRQQITDMFMMLLRTSVCLIKSTELLAFMIVVKNYITVRFVLPGNIDSNCYLTLITLEVVNNYFGGRSSMLDTNPQPQPQPELTVLLSSIDVDIPPKIEEKQHSQPSPAKEDICKRFESEVYEITPATIELESERYFSTNILEEADNRKARSSFRKMWKALRCFNSVWSHPEFSMQIDTLYNRNIWNYEKGRNNTIFTLRINKQESKSRARFLLEPRMIEPKIVREFQESLKTPKGPIKLESSMGQLLKSITEVDEKKEIVSNKYLSLGKGLLETFYPLRSDPDNPLVLKRANIITTLTVRTGSMCITNDKILFIYSNYEEKESHYAMVRNKLNSESSIFKEWSLAHIKELFRRRYINRRSALEIFFIDGKSVFLHFPDGDCEEVAKRLQRMKPQKCPQMIYHKSLDPKKILESSSLMKKWGSFELSNFEYLMQVNCLAGRSYKDVTQYHVFPWILTSFAEKIDLANEGNYRDLSKNMGSLGSQTRIMNFQERYNNYDPHLGGEKFHYGTHYSSPGIIYHYMIRISPFTEGAKELQSGKFDFADRLFFSIEDSWKNCTSEYSDVRELIPEFYFLPDMFLNESHYDFGMMQNKRRVNNVELPLWARQNPYLYVAKLRKAFELDNVSRHLNEWIDLIYGWKQRGEQAVKALNVFVQITYEDSVNFETMSDPKLRKAIESQILNFGQTPSQIFIKPHPQRSEWTALGATITDIEFKPKVYRPTNKKQSERWLEVNPLHQPDESIIRMKWIKDSKLICIHRNGNIINYKWYSQGLNRIPFQCAIEKELKLERLAKSKYDPGEYYDTSLDLEEFPLEVICSGQFLLVGGICQGRLVQLRVESGDLVERYRSHTEPITIIRSAKDNFVITGDSSGSVVLWRIEGQKLEVNHRFNDHSLKVNNIFISHELRAFASCSDDGSVQLYNFITGKRLRAYFHPQGKPISNILITTCPLACLVMFCSRDRMILTYSINGQLIQRLHEKDSGSLLVPTLIRDARSLEIVVYGNQKGEIVMRDLPFLDMPRKFVVARDATVTSICVSKDLRYLICSCSDGEMSVITDPNATTKTF